MLSFLRASSPPRTYLADKNPVVYEDGACSAEFRAAGSDYVMRHRHPPYDKDNPSLITPPLHYHMYQTELFRIHSGTCHLYQKTLQSPWKTICAGDPDAPKTATIPPGVYHSFHNASTTEPMIIDVNLLPEKYEDEERFFRNFLGYIDDCKKAGHQPSLFQLFVFLKTIDTPLALPAPTEWLGLVVSRIFMNIMAWYGSWLLGYKESYEEYYSPRKSL